MKDSFQRFLESRLKEAEHNYNRASRLLDADKMAEGVGAIEALTVVLDEYKLQSQKKESVAK